MSKRTFALIGLFVALTTGAALAQEEPTYEGRGYGGPLGVGPNFQQGGQWGPPIYGAGREHSSTTERYREPQRPDRVQRKRTTDDDDVKTAKTTPVTEQRKTDLAKSDKSKSSNENSTIASVASNADPVKGQLSKTVNKDA